MSEQEPLPTDTQVDEAGSLLLKAACVIEERGWVQGALCSTDGRVCALGSILVAAGFTDAQINQTGIGLTRADHSRAILRLVGKIGCSVAGWNDWKGRSKEDVTSALRAAAVHK